MCSSDLPTDYSVGLFLCQLFVGLYEAPSLLLADCEVGPFRIRKLSPPASMVLAGQLAGRVDQCRGKINPAEHLI